MMYIIELILAPFFTFSYSDICIFDEKKIMSHTNTLAVFVLICYGNLTIFQDT